MGLLIQLIGLINILFPLIILVVAFYMYFAVEKKTVSLLLGLSSLFFVLQGIEAQFNIIASLVPLLDEGDSMWPSILLFLSFLFLLIMAEPWKIRQK
ncbi:MAG: hypothetical protein ACXAEU_19690 [Candidatus Hodarchaeales archaeon]|jgi:hypothetical protein